MIARFIIEVSVPDGTKWDATKRPVTRDGLIASVRNGAIKELYGMTDANFAFISVVTEEAPAREGGAQ